MYKRQGISIATLDAARNNGLISYVQYVQNGCVYFTSAGLQAVSYTHLDVYKRQLLWGFLY